MAALEQLRRRGGQHANADFIGQRVRRGQERRKGDRQQVRRRKRQAKLFGLVLRLFSRTAAALARMRIGIARGGGGLTGKKFEAGNGFQLAVHGH